MADQPTDAAHVEHIGAPEHHPEPATFGLLAAPQWIALAMVLVIALLLWKRVPSLVGKALDKKIAGIRAELDEAEQLRRDAETLKAEYEAKAAAADAERATMLERARHEAEAIVEQARTDTASLIERRTRMAEDKIAAAERHAIEEVRARAARAAAAAAAHLIADKLTPEGDKAMVDKTIAELGAAH
ncbi:MAG TPA: F0F1 ATP synthase subunit B [Allosphingosinicella sp.]|jgi:F-type H+-transporting ATPase subunit b